MSIPVLIIGKSGSGKSASLRNLDPARVGLFNVLGKPLPFRGQFQQIQTDDPAQIARSIQKGKREIYIVDDAGYLFTNNFMRGHSDKGKGSQKFDFYNDLADSFWKLINAITSAETANAVRAIIAIARATAAHAPGEPAGIGIFR